MIVAVLSIQSELWLEEAGSISTHRADAFINGRLQVLMFYRPILLSHCNIETITTRPDNFAEDAAVANAADGAEYHIVRPHSAGDGR